MVDSDDITEQLALANYELVVEGSSFALGHQFQSTTTQHFFINKAQAVNIEVLQACFEYDAVDSDNEDDIGKSEFDSTSITMDQEYKYVKSSECASRAVKAFQVPEVSAEKPRPAGHKNLDTDSSLDIKSPMLTDLSNLLLVHVCRRAESALMENELTQARLGRDSFDPELPTSLLLVRETLERLESSQALSIDPPKLELSDLGDEFSLGSFQFLGNTEGVDSAESRDSSKAISETTMSFVEVLVLAPSEPRLTEKEIRQPLVRSGSSDSGIA